MDYYADMDSDRKVRAIMLQADNAGVISDWAHAVEVEEIDALDPSIKSPGLNVQCGDTVKRASLGDYVIKHGDGTYDVMSPLRFMRSFEKLEG